MHSNYDKFFDESLSIEDTSTGRLRLARGRTEGGFDPYNGAISTTRTSRKKDLRKLGEWLEAKRRADEVRRENELASAPPAPSVEPSDS
jgi:hypothetical protein